MHFYLRHGWLPIIVVTRLLLRCIDSLMPTCLLSGTILLPVGRACRWKHDTCIYIIHKLRMAFNHSIYGVLRHNLLCTSSAADGKECYMLYRIYIGSQMNDWVMNISACAIESNLPYCYIDRVGQRARDCLYWEYRMPMLPLLASDILLAIRNIKIAEK